MRDCERLAPFGRGNPRPALRIDDVCVTAPPRLMGKDQRHLLMHLKHPDGSAFLKAKWWDGRQHLERIGQRALWKPRRVLVTGAGPIGLLAAFSDQYLSTRWTNAWVFAVLVLILLFRPTGLLGENTTQKV